MVCKKCKNRIHAGGCGMSTRNCEICKQPFTFQFGICICEDCIKKHSLCFKCGIPVIKTQETPHNQH